MPVIDEHFPVAHENAVLDRDAGTNEAVRLDLATLADGDRRLDLDKGADQCTGADRATVQVVLGVLIGAAAAATFLFLLAVAGRSWTVDGDDELCWSCGLRNQPKLWCPNR
jgi:anti-sigma factor RsiW